MATGTDHLRTPADRVRLGVRAGAEFAGLGLMAAVGDPVAALALGSAHLDSYTLFEQVRRRGTLVRSRTGVYATASRALCDAVLRDPRFGKQRPYAARSGTELLTDHASGTMSGSFLDLDAPDHTRLRRVVAPAFRPAAIRALVPRIEARLEGLLDAVEAGGPEFDVIGDLASPFPVAVISDLLGIPDADLRRFAEIGADVGQSLNGARTVGQAERLRRGADELEVLFDRLAADRRRHPGDDVVSLLVAAEAEDRVSAVDLTATCGLLLLAGFETTTNLIGNAVAALQRHPDLWWRLAEEPGLAEAVVEETLRWESPVQLTIRFAGEPLELAGVPLARHTGVLVLIAAANRDPEVYADPDRFDPHRFDPHRLDADRGDGPAAEPEHLAFAAGPHYCLGALLARIEGAVALRGLARRVPGLRLRPGAARRRRGSAIRGYTSLPARAG